MTQEQAKVHAPDLVGGYWVNSEPVRMPDQKGRMTLEEGCSCCGS